MLDVLEHVHFLNSNLKTILRSFCLLIFLFRKDISQDFVCIPLSCVFVPVKSILGWLGKLLRLVQKS